jgi:hypothetical protein
MFDSKIRDVARSELYFGQWQYAVQFQLPHASFLRDLDHEKIDTAIRWRNSWKQNKTTSHIKQETQKILHKACDFFQSRTRPYKKMVSGHSIWVYTNHPDDFQKLESIPTGRVKKIERATLTLAPNAVTLVDPQHCFRTYFRERWLNQDELDRLRRYFSARPDQFRLSPGFERFVTGNRVYLSSSNFVDHNEPNADLLINMAVPGVVRKTLPIVGRAK